eukprot:m.273233 g.273233  ORF g.273233 m.273233 type:complete len:77 (+) comp26881_c0_seq4:1456-1686(+)
MPVTDSAWQPLDVTSSRGHQIHTIATSPRHICGLRVGLTTGVNLCTTLHGHPSCACTVAEHTPLTGAMQHAQSPKT